MPSPFSQGAQNADKAFSQFANGDVTFFTVTLTTLQTVGTTAHGLSAAPDFVILGLGALDSAASVGASWSATATTLTVSHDCTTAIENISVFAANIS